MSKTNRATVYDAIDSERNYQDALWGKTLSKNREPGPGQEGGDRSLDEFILYIQGYANDASQQASHFVDPRNQLHTIRKIAALCVVAMEQHGALRRPSITLVAAEFGTREDGSTRYGK